MLYLPITFLAGVIVKSQEILLPNQKSAVIAKSPRFEHNNGLHIILRLKKFLQALWDQVSQIQFSECLSYLLLGCGK